MATEAKLQTEVIRWLKKNGCWVMKVSAAPGVPVGTSDIFFCKEGFYGWLEVKTSKTSKKQPLQAEFVEAMDNWSYARFIYPENKLDIFAELEKML